MLRAILQPVLALIAVCFAVMLAVLFAVAMLVPAGASVPATGSTPALCLDAARAAAARHGIPARMMHAITLVETRRKVGGISGPWPWTLNINGKGYWYETRAEALARATREIANGKRSIDLGCFQLNYRWHGENFSALDDMLEPALAADYAAKFLGQLFVETGDWMRAAGLYHSRTPVYARRYRGMVGRALASLDSGADTPGASAGSGNAPDAAPLPGPRATLAGSGLATPALTAPARPGPAHAIILAAARIASDPARAAAPGAVMLRMFTNPARPLLATPGMKP